MKKEEFNYAAFEVGRLYTRNEVADIGGVARRSDRAWTGMTGFKNCTLLWITLDKSKKQEDHRYNDCFRDDGRKLLWDSQNKNTLTGSVIQEITNGRPVFVMARVSDRKKRGNTPPFCYCGEITNSVAGREEKPVRLRSDVAQFSKKPTEALRDIYNWKPDGPRLVTDAEVYEKPLPLSKTAAKRQSRGQGWLSDPERKKATERRAILVAMDHYAALGWDVEDVGVPGTPFDLLCSREGETLRVEVKGTRGDASSVNVTHGEVTSARDTDIPTHLFIVHGITVVTEGDTLTGEGGEIKCLDPWIPEDADLTPTMFRYEVPDN
jgi:hypothetical protein